MQREITITLDEQVYLGLQQAAGRRHVSEFVNALLKSHVVQPDLDSAYAGLAADEAREAEALEWAEATLGDLPDEAW